MTELEKLQHEFKAYKETAEEIHQAYINKHNEWFKLYEENKRLKNALSQIIGQIYCRDADGLEPDTDEILEIAKWGLNE